MKQRLNYYPKFPEAFQKLNEINALIVESSIDKKLKHLIDIRVSQINGCLFCIDMHVKEAKIGGERELRLHHLSAWQESPLFTDSERAALRWAEAVTKLSQGPVQQEAFEEIKAHFSEKEIVEITMAIAHINAWNRFGATFLSIPGSMDSLLGLEKAGL